MYQSLVTNLNKFTSSQFTFTAQAHALDRQNPDPVHGDFVPLLCLQTFKLYNVALKTKPLKNETVADVSAAGHIQRKI